MVDFIKLRVLDGKRFELSIMENGNIELTNTFNPATGEVMEYPKRGHFENLKISINPKYSNIKGSLHKFENIIFEGKEHNHNAFSYSQLNELIPFLVDELDLTDNNSLNYLEFGFNLPLNMDPKVIVEERILMYDYTTHNKNLNFQGRGDYKEFIKTDFSLKIYNKSKQYRLNQHILRVEIKITRKRFLETLGIYRIEDLLRKESHYALFLALSEAFHKVIMVDDYTTAIIASNDLEKLSNYTNSNYWIRIKKEKSAKVIYRLKQDFKKIISVYELDSTKKYLIELMTFIFWQLIQDYESNKLAA